MLSRYLICDVASAPIPDAGVVLLAQAVRDAIEPRAHMTGMPVNLREPDSRLFRIALTFDWFVDR